MGKYKIPESLTIYHCPIDGSICKTGTYELRSYARYLERLAETDSPDIISQGISWCPWDCSAQKCKQANILICKELGRDPAKMLDINGVPLQYSRQR